MLTTFDDSELFLNSLQAGSQRLFAQGRVTRQVTARHRKPRQRRLLD